MEVRLWGKQGAHCERPAGMWRKEGLQWERVPADNQAGRQQRAGREKGALRHTPARGFHVGSVNQLNTQELKTSDGERQAIRGMCTSPVEIPCHVIKEHKHL